LVPRFDPRFIEMRMLDRLARQALLRIRGDRRRWYEVTVGGVQRAIGRLDD
jgi:hypothetical protein